ncbi:alpha-catulin isoform X2 [Anopheles funestus]|uniref:alpha-catulin isoform X2 n=1 Tax=Anopheles funestus TaxID=62324 RepID=UPI0020C6E3E3|nr:alpha-catulin isoform X2 [Anopheles funestus]
MNDKSYFERSASVSASDDIGRRIAAAAGGGSSGTTLDRAKASASSGGLGVASKIGESRRKSASFDVDRNRGPEPMASATTSGAAGGGSSRGGGTGASGSDTGIRRRSSSNSSVHRRSQSKISTLVQHRSEQQHHTSEQKMRAIGRVGQAVNLAVERFVTVGETIADDNPEIKQDMYDACKEARAAGSSIERLCDIAATDPTVGYSPRPNPIDDRGPMIRAARTLLSSVTRVLLLADIVVVKQLLLAKDRVARTLGRLESVANFTEFVKAFSVFGAEMVELAHVTGNRQNDLKDERRRAQMSSARQVLERSTMMLLTSSKTCLRHPECAHSKENRDTVFCQMRRAMDLIHYVVKDGILESASDRNALRQVPEWDSERATAFTCLRHFSRLIEISRPSYDRNAGPGVPGGVASNVAPPSVKDRTPTMGPPLLSKECISPTQVRDKETGIAEHRRERDLMRRNSERDRERERERERDRDRDRNSIGHSREYSTREREFPKYDNKADLGISIFSTDTREQLLAALDKVCEKTQDFTDSAYTSHEHRENILLLCDRAKLELNQLMRIAVSMEQYPNSSFDIDGAIESVLAAAQDLTTQLTLTAQDQSAELSHIIKSGIDIANSLRNIALNQELDRLQECADRFHEHIDHVLEVCKLLRQIALTETLQVQAKFTEINVRIYGPQVITAARALTSHPQSKIAKENLEVFVDMWQWLSTDVTTITKEVIDLAQTSTKADKTTEYLSLPRPGKHGTTSKPLKPTRLDSEEQEKIAKTGLEMKMVTNEMDAETDKWNGASEENNDIVKRAKNMSAMAFSMYQFTKGEGTLRTTQDLFTQAEYFAEEANRLYKVVRQFSYQVPAGPPKKELLEHLDKVPTYVQTLQFTVKDPTVGKAATFVKVDHVIQETKNLMNVISKVVSTCFVCADRIFELTGVPFDNRLINVPTVSSVSIEPSTTSTKSAKDKYKLDFSGLAGRAAAGGSRDDDGASGLQGDSKGSTTSTEASM